MKLLISLLLTCAALSACGGRDPVDRQANDTAGLPAINDAVPDATGSPPERGPAPATEAGSASIPAALHGRWGMTPVDCTSTLGDTKGLLIVGPDGLRFYESRAVPTSSVQTSEDSISGDFSFTGEGETWTKFQALELKGQELVRTGRDPVGSFTYARCK